MDGFLAIDTSSSSDFIKTLRMMSQRELVSEDVRLNSIISEGISLSGVSQASTQNTVSPQLKDMWGAPDSSQHDKAEHLSKEISESYTMTMLNSPGTGLNKVPALEGALNAKANYSCSDSKVVAAFSRSGTLSPSPETDTSLENKMPNIKNHHKGSPHHPGIQAQPTHSPFYGLSHGLLEDKLDIRNSLVDTANSLRPAETKRLPFFEKFSGSEFEFGQINITPSCMDIELPIDLRENIGDKVVMASDNTYIKKIELYSKLQNWVEQYPLTQCLKRFADSSMDSIPTCKTIGYKRLAKQKGEKEEFTPIMPPVNDKSNTKDGTQSTKGPLYSLTKENHQNVNKAASNKSMHTKVSGNSLNEQRNDPAKHKHSKGKQSTKSGNTPSSHQRTREKDDPFNRSSKTNKKPPNIGSNLDTERQEKDNVDFDRLLESTAQSLGEGENNPSLRRGSCPNERYRKSSDNVSGMGNYGSSSANRDGARIGASISETQSPQHSSRRPSVRDSRVPLSYGSRESRHPRNPDRPHWTTGRATSLLQNSLSPRSNKKKPKTTYDTRGPES